MLLVGVHNAVDPANPWPDRRAQEYLPGHHRRRCDAHLRFVVDEVIPWAGQRLGAVDRPWIAAGFSNGGAWAIAAAQRRPEVFAQVAAFSVGLVPGRITGRARTAGIRHYLAAGTLETGFRRATRQWAERPQRPGWTAATTSGLAATTSCGGGSSSPAALGWLLAPP